MDLPQKYSAKDIEAKWRAFWEKEHIYQFNPNTDKDIFSIDTPPPTVSGYMHAGHSFSYSQQDFIARFQRMRGKEVFYPFGTDDNGLATERLIERMKNVKSAQMSRKEFIKLCLATLNEIRPRFVQDWKNLGMSCDFDIFYSTINDHCRKISQRSFIELYKAGREYRKESPTMWCPECQTAIAQVELEDKNLKSHFVDLRFKLIDSAAKGSKAKYPAEVIIATTRPEMLPACVAIFVHPDDARYKLLVGKKARVPLFNHEVTILGDERANPEKGTGVVMCCTFGDQTDIEWYKAHNLALKVAISKDGHMTSLAGLYSGLKIRDARKKIIEDLKKEGLLVAQKEIEHAVNVHERCGIEVEILQSKQWFIRYLDLRDEFLQYGAKLNWYPEFMKSRYDNWIKGLQWDWCISRQRHFGIPFPVWYCEKCDEPILAREQDLPVDPLEDKAPVGSCPKCKHTTFVPEKDVLDTWATSSLTPRLAIELYKDHPVFKKLYPMHLRPQAHDIISFWLFNTVVKSCLHYKTIPWQDVAISGWLLAPDGTKMSKSKGNTMVPQEVMEKY